MMRFLNLTKKKLQNMKGTSLAEMLLCVVIVGFISMIVCTGVLMAFKTTDDVSQTSYGITVSDTILNQISADLNTASSQLDNHSGIYLSGQTGSPVIGFISSKGAPTFIAAFENPDMMPDRRGQIGKGYLMRYNFQYIDYENSIANPASIWQMDGNAYMGYVIDELKFSYIGDKNGYPKIQVELKLRDIRTGKTHEARKIICCYNVDNRGNDKIYTTKSTEDIVSYKWEDI